MSVDRSAGLASLSKKLSDGAMFSLRDKRGVESISTGVATVDAALGTGGFVRGGQHILYGSPSSGKSALVYSTIASMQRSDPEAMAAIIDVERSASPEWLERFGVDVDRVRVIIEPTIEECVNAFQLAVRANCFDLILIDSLGAVIRAVDFDGKDGSGGDANTQQVGGSSRVITSWVNKANAELTRIEKMENVGSEVIKPAIIYINQVRDVIGSRFPTQGMPGGNALKHMMGTITRVQASGATADRMIGTVDGTKMQVGQRVMCTVEKNKYAPPRRQGGYLFCYEECDEYGFGVDSSDALYSLAVERGVIEAKGAWSSFQSSTGEVKLNGRNAFCERLRNDRELYDEVYGVVMGGMASEAVERAI